eukprot:maker-scaffold_14-snap-gene-11.51-mRNA-1 protein AED:0.01 eAED:0.01 QI:100/1/1/1/1/1/3/30/717
MYNIGKFNDITFDFEQDPEFQRRRREERKQEIQKNDRRFKTIVCRHWVKGLCMKMDKCEFLHEIDLERMPECRWGEKCQSPDCLYKHTKEEDRLECSYYTLGFCAHGSSCRFRHIRKEKIELPKEAKWDLVFSQNYSIGNQPKSEAKENVFGLTEKQKENFKVALCKHFETTGNCPYGERCHFAHGAAELRAPNRKRNHETMEGPSSSELLQKLVREMREANDVILNPFQDQGNGLKTPDILVPGGEYKSVRYVIVRSQSFRSLAASFKHSVWAVKKTTAEALNVLFKERSKILLFFAVEETKQFGGCAIVKSLFKVLKSEVATSESEEMYIGDISWQHLCSLSFTKVGKLSWYSNDLKTELPVGLCDDGALLKVDKGRALTIALFREDAATINKNTIDPTLKIKLYEPQQALQVHELAAKRHESSGPTQIQVIKINKPGYVFICPTANYLDETLGRLLFGTNPNVVPPTLSIQEGTPLFLFSKENLLFFGVFESLTALQMNIEPTAFDGTLPLQVKVKVLHKYNPLHISIVTQLGNEVMRSINEYEMMPVAEMRQLVQLFATNNSTKLPGPRQGAVSEPKNNSVRRQLPLRFMPPKQGAAGEIIQDILIEFEFRPKFNPVARLAGNGGYKLRNITQATNGEVRVEALGPPMNPPPVVVTVFARNERALENGKELILTRIDELLRSHEVYVRRGEELRRQRLERERGVQSFQGNRQF